MTTIEKIEIEAKNKEVALKEACRLFSEKVEDEFSLEDISIELLKEKKKLFRLFGKSKVYQATLELKEKIESKNGEFKIEVSDEGIFLIVKQPVGNGREVKMDIIEEALEKKEIVEVDYAAVSEALTLDGEKVKIADRKYELDRDAELEFKLSKDKMKAYISHTPPLGGRKFTVDDVIEELKKEGIVFGIKREEFAEVFNPKKPLEDFLIAVGQDPVPGEDGRIDFQFDINSSEKKVNLLEDGSADFRNLGRIINVEPGDLLATKVLAVEGEPGKNVIGEDVPPPPVKDIDIPVGENVELSEDGMELTAGIEGQVVYNHDAISVLDVYTVKGDVDLSTGNIDFTGSVIVSGNVNDGMEIKSEGNVLIEGSVYGGNIEADGQIVIKKGFIGAVKGTLKAKGDINVKFIENGLVITEGDLVVQDAIMHSNIDAGNKVVVEEKKGLIVGGKVRATKEIIAKNIGSNLATPTEVSVGITPGTRDEYNNKDSLFKDKQEKLDQVIKNIKLLKDQREKNDGRLPANKQDLLNQLTRMRFSLAAEIEEIKEERKSLKAKLEEGKDGRIKVQDTIYTGVIVYIGTSVKRIDEVERFVQYYLDDEQIKSKPYS
ncbi:polymerase [Orenia metallireducens]|uniref:Polymerase n=1 Tax=Orenia metallireducens TaxID=1413210 RepID=A0A1C0A9Z9_9FIRM|nr:FapA family protein [Orenia metallireducens]OCL27111.1 polymerase [Orenia metallireducens]